MSAECFRVRTADGDRLLDPADGYVLPHEHLISDLRRRWAGPGDWDQLDPPEAQFSLGTLDTLRHAPQATSRENLVLSDWYLAATELREARATGCQLVVELTVEGLEPLPRLSRAAAAQAGLAVVVAVGRYMEATLADTDRGTAAGELADRWLGQVETGIDGCQVGIIGEIGVGAQFTTAERRSLQAAARVQRQTGLPVNVHVEPRSHHGKAVLDELEHAGADLSRVVLSHQDFDLDDTETIELLERGCYAEFDLFGRGPLFRFAGRYAADDEARVTAIEHLCARGFTDRLLLSHDICMRHCLRRYGGWGYGHLGRYIIPVLTDRLGADTTTTLTRLNPLRLLALPPGVRSVPPA